MAHRNMMIDPRAKWKSKIRRHPKLSRVLQFIFDPAFVITRQRDKLLHRLSSEARVLNLGSGAKHFGSNVVNFDLETFGNVNVVGDGQFLPFSAEVFDLILCEYVLEHVPYPKLLVQEMVRTLKVGGCLYVTTPFMQTFHGNPDDFQRYTTSGLGVLFHQLEVVECKPYGGPTSALCNMIKEYLALLFSFNSKFLYSVLSQLFILPVFPFKFLDLVLARSINAHNLSFSLYFIGRKPRIC